MRYYEDITSITGGHMTLTHDKPRVTSHFSLVDWDCCLGTSELFLVVTGEVALR